MSELEKMSKYARKKALQKKREAEEAKAVKKAALAKAFNEVNKINNPPKPKAEKKPKGEPTPPRGLINDLDDKPKRMSQLLSEAAAMLKEAYEISAEVLLLSAKGIQQAEPRAINQFLLVTHGRVENMAIRASLIPNVKQGE
jgi:flagellar motor protein MotB